MHIKSKEISLLVVDENADERAALIHELRNNFPELRVMEVGSEKDWEEALRAGDFNLVVIEEALSWRNSAGILQDVRKQKPGCPALMVTASPQVEGAVAALKAGFDDYLHKTERDKLHSALQIAAESVVKNQNASPTSQDYQRVFECAHDAIIIFRPEDEVILDANQRACEIYGFDHTELIGLSLAHISKDISEGKEKITETLAVTGNVHFETIQYHKDGHEIILDVSATKTTYRGQEAILSINRDITRQKETSIMLTKSEKRFQNLVEALPQTVFEVDADGKIIGFSEFARNITGHKTTEDALKQNELRYRKLFDNAPIGLYRTTPEGDILDANPGLLNMLGYPNLETIQAENVADLYFEPGTREQWQREITAPDSFITSEFTARKRDGTCIWVRGNTRIIRDDAGQITCYEGSLEDITRQKMAENALRASEQHFRAFLESAPIAIILVEPDGKIVFENALTAEMFGYEKGELLDQTIEILLPENYRARHKQHRKTFIAKQFFRAINKAQNLVAVRKDGTRFPVEIALNIITGKDSPNTLAFIVDITERKQAKAELERQTRELTTLIDIGQTLAASLNIEDVLDKVIIATSSLLLAERLAVLLLNEQGELYFASASGEQVDKIIGKTIPVTEGGAGKVMQTRKSIWVQAPAEQHKTYRKIETTSDFHTQSLLAAPLIWSGEVIGVIEAVHRQPNAFTNKDLQFLEATASWAAIAIGNARQHDTIKRQLKESQALTTVSHALNIALDPENILQLIVDLTSNIISPGEGVVIHLFDEEQQALVPKAVSGQVKMFPEFTMRPGQGVAGQVMKSGHAISIGDAKQDPRFISDGKIRLRSLLVAPIQSSSRRLGTISTHSKQTWAFSLDDENLLVAMGVQVALAIERARLFEEIQQALAKETATRDQLIQTEKLSIVGRMVASIAHELNNPLQGIQNALYLINLEPNLKLQTKEDLQIALTETDRMADLIMRLRGVYRPVTLKQFQKEDINSLLEEIQRIIAAHMRQNNVTFSFTPHPTLPLIFCLRDQIKQVLLNVTLNSIEAMPEGGMLHIQTQHIPAQTSILIKIKDTGKGVSPEDYKNIFDPFFTTKEVGTGLGLSISYDIIQRHQGKIELESQQNEGTTCNIWLPIQQHEN